MQEILRLQPKDFLKGISTGEYTNDGIFTHLKADLFKNPSEIGLLQPAREKETLMSSLSDEVQSLIQVQNSKWYGFGDGGYLYEINRTDVSVMDSGNESGRDGGSDLIVYKEKLHYFHTDGCGTYDLNSSFNNTTYTTDISASQYPAVVFQDILFFGNGQYIGEINNTTLDAQKIDLGKDYEIQDIRIYNNYLAILVTDKRDTESDSEYSKLFLWNGYSGNMQYEYPIEEECTSLENYAANLIIFGENIMLFNGGSFEVLRELENIVSRNQTYYGRNMLYWIDDGALWSYGSPTSRVSASIQRYFSIIEDSVLANCNRNRTEFITAKDDIYIYDTDDTRLEFETIKFSTRRATLTKIVISFEDALQSGDSGNLLIHYNNTYLEIPISYTNEGAVLYIEKIIAVNPAEYIKLEWNGDLQAKINNITLYGHKSKRPA